LPSWVYFLRLESGKLYVGATKDIDQRCKEHFAGKACRTTRLDAPISLVCSEEFETFTEARKRENQVKRWSRAKKEALLSGNVTRLRELSKSRKTW
jgi:putative endonuclease